jgi:hypothetical protein
VEVFLRSLASCKVLAIWLLTKLLTSHGCCCCFLLLPGYMTGDPKKRNPGAAICFFSFVGLLLTTAVLGVRTALGM